MKSLHECLREAVVALRLGETGTGPQQRRWLFDMAGAHDADALEVGTCAGGTTIGIARGLRANRVVHTFDTRQGGPAKLDYSDPRYVEMLLGNLQLCGLLGTVRAPGLIRFYERDVSDWEPSETPRLGLVFVDGCHLGEAPRRDMERTWPWLIPGGYLAAHDTQIPDVAAAISGFYAAHPDALKCEPVSTMEVMRKG